MTSRALSLAFLLLFGCAGSRSHLKIGKTAEGDVVEAEGFAPNDSKDILLVKRASLVDAQKNAVEKAVGVFVSGRTLVEKAVAIENNILARTDGYIKKFDIISEGVDGALYKTKIRALVALKDLERDLNQMSLLNQPELSRPLVRVTIEESIEKSMYTDEASAANALKQALSERGFVVVEGDRAKDAELDISGKAAAFPFQAEGLGGFVSYRARLSIKALRVGTGDVLSTLSKEASGLGGNADLAALKALETVGGLVGSDLAASLPASWAKGKNILVLVEGVKSFSDVDRVRKHLTAQPGVDDITLRKYDEELAQFELELGSSNLAELATSLEKSQTLSLKIIEAKSQSLRLQWGE